MNELILGIEAEEKAMSLLKQKSLVIQKSGLAPSSLKTTEQVMTVAMMGKELGLEPMTALNNISVINGKPTLEAKLMLSLALKKYPTAKYRVVKNTTELAEVELGRPGQEPSRFSFTMDQARAAGLTGKSNWKNYPADMLLWRAISRAVRFIFPDVLMVASYTSDEIETIDVTPIEPIQIEEPVKEEATELDDFIPKTKVDETIEKIIKRGGMNLTESFQELKNEAKREDS